MRFDRVITNPPFSQNYSAGRHPVPGALRLRVLPPSWQEGRPDVRAAHAGRAATGGGHRHAARRPFPRWRRGRDPQGFIEDDLLEAVIGLGPNLFYGTASRRASSFCGRRKRSRPSVVARCSSSTPTASTTRAERRTYCFPSTSRRSSLHRDTLRGGCTAFSRLFSSQEIAGERVQPEYPSLCFTPQTPRAPGIPVLSWMRLMSYWWPRALYAITSSLARRPTSISPTASVPAARSVLSSRAIQALVTRRQPARPPYGSGGRPSVIALGLPETQDPMELRAELMKTFAETVRPLGLLDAYKVDGVIASWWTKCGSISALCSRKVQQALLKAGYGPA